MLKNSLQNLPIRAIHYNEILCLFRKAHGPLLQLKQVDLKKHAKSSILSQLLGDSETHVKALDSRESNSNSLN